MIYDFIYSLLVLTEKLAFFNKQLLGFMIFLTVQVKNCYTLPSLCMLYFNGSKCLKFSEVVGSNF